MGFFEFSDPASSQAPIESVEAAVPTRTSRRRRGSVSRRRRSSVDRAKTSSTIPTEISTGQESPPSSKTLRRSSTTSAAPRRRNSLMNSLSAAMNTSMHGSMHGTNDNVMDSSMQNHLGEMENFVNHLKSSGEKERKKIFKLAATR